MSKLRISSVKCVRIKHQTYILKVQCTDEPNSFFVGRTAAQISEFRSKLLEELKSSKEVSVPDFKAVVKWYESNKDDKKKKAVDEFCQQILQLPANVTETEAVTQFFTSSAADSEEQVCKTSRHNSSKVHQSQKDSQGTPTTLSSPTTPVSPATPGSPITPATPVTATTEQSPVDGSFGQYEDLSGFMPTETSSTAANSNVVIDAVYAEVYKNNSSVRPVTQSSLPARNIIDSEDVDGLQYGGEYAEIPATTAVKPTVSAAMDSVDTQHTATTDNNNETFASLPNKNPEVTLPVTPIPPIPQMAPPTLSSPTELPEDIESVGDQNEVQVIAVAEYTSSTDNILSFTKGDLATLIVQSNTKWWCIKLGNAYGWVPADYWRMLNPDAECVSLNVNSKTSAPWFVGKLSRVECEELLVLHGKQQHFVVRESTNLVGHYALSVKYNERVHHFPIELTPDERYYIGKHHFKTVNNVITYYKKNALFYNESGEGVTLGSPLVIIKH